MRYGTIWLLAGILLFATIGTTAVPPESYGSDGYEDPGILGTDHAVFGEVNTSGGHPPDATPVKITVYHVDHYTDYEVSGGVVSGWYSKTLPGTEQGTNWDIGDDIWANVTYDSNNYYNKTVITSGTNQQIDVDLYGGDHAVWGTVYDFSDNTVPDGTPVRVIVYHIDHYTTYNVTGGTSSGYFTKTLPGADYGLNWNYGDPIWVNATYQGYEYSNQTTITTGTNQQIDVHTRLKISLNTGWNLVSLPLVQTNTSIQAVLSSIDGEWDYAQYYNATDASDHWKTYAAFKPASLNDLWDLNHTMGFWLHTTVACTLNVTGSLPTSTNIQLYAGWNLVGYPTLNNTTTVADALAGTGYDKPVEGFNATAPYRISQLDDTYVMKPGEAYWIHVPADTVWVVDW